MADETVGWTCFLTRRWESHVERFLQQHLAPGDRAIDVGANLGYFTAVMAAAVGPRGHVWSFEPTPPIAGDLELSVAANGHDHVDVLRVALAEQNGTATISFDPRVAGSSSLVAAATERSRTYEVAVRRLDDLYAGSQVEAPALIKIDVEGGELAVLRGASGLLRHAQPHVIFEFNAQMARAAGWDLPDVVELFECCGPYRLHKLTPTGMEELSSSFVSPAEGFLDLVAVSRPVRR